MAKRQSLAESMKSVQRTPAAPVTAEPRQVSKLPPTERPEGKGYFAATRQGMKRVTVAVSPDEHRRLKRLSADTGRSIENLMREALSNLFVKLE